MTATLDQPVVRPVVGRAPARPTQAEVNRAIVAEGRYANLRTTRQEASDLQALLAYACKCMRMAAKITLSEVGEIPFHLSQEELDASHRLLEVIMPDEVVVATTGGAHDLINRRYCRDNELGLRHTVAGTEIVDCAVTIDLITTTA
jgi:hypothetical protein